MSDSLPPQVIAAYEALLACYRSGQISEKQWTAHLEDQQFADWLKQQMASH